MQLLARLCFHIGHRISLVACDPHRPFLAVSVTGRHDKGDAPFFSTRIVVLRPLDGANVDFNCFGHASSSIGCQLLDGKPRGSGVQRTVRPALVSLHLAEAA